MPSKESQRLPSLNARMKARRAQLGLTGAELAERANISASYVSLIESGAKVPDEEVAARLARVLGDDEDLYRGWARAARLGLDKLELLNRLEAIAQTPAYVDLVESGQALPSIASETARDRQQDLAEGLRARLREVASKLATRPASGARPQTAPDPIGVLATEAAVLSVPILPEGTDPIHLEAGFSASGSHLSIDQRLLGAHAGLIFAYEVTATAMKHLRGLASPGDFVILRQGGDVAPDRICAVRTGQGIVLARVLLKDRSLLLLPGEGQPDFETVDLKDAVARESAIAGTQVLLIRR
jgi:transcriptional regulator with XRE-family HTH domain